MKREDMKAAAKFRTACDTCGERQPRASTAFTAEQWMRRHEAAHRDAHTSDATRKARSRSQEELARTPLTDEEKALLRGLSRPNDSEDGLSLILTAEEDAALTHSTAIHAAERAIEEVERKKFYDSMPWNQPGVSTEPLIKPCEEKS